MYTWSGQLLISIWFDYSRQMLRYIQKKFKAPKILRLVAKLSTQNHSNLQQLKTGGKTTVMRVELIARRQDLYWVSEITAQLKRSQVRLVKEMFCPACVPKCVFYNISHRWNWLLILKIRFPDFTWGLKFYRISSVSLSLSQTKYKKKIKK